MIVIIIQQIYIFSKKPNSEEDVFADYSYKSFYGEWQITEFMGIGQHYRGERQEEYIGNRIYYSSKEIYINDEIMIVNPRYHCAIIPMDKWHMYKSSLHPAVGAREMLGRNDEYFVQVLIGNIYTKNKDVFEFGSTFYIVNEDELILETDDGWYKMERLNYLDGYPDIMSSV